MNREFEWGVATAAYQIEGGREDGKGDSIWDTFCHEPGRILNGDTGDVACDHYHRFREDVALMAGLGVTAYRFSVAWSRVLPEGVGRVNERGMRFYEELLGELQAHGIRPYVTLYHWDLPQALFERGGWLNPDSPKWFAEYAEAVASRFGGRAADYFTINEPQCVLGGMNGTEQAPGMKYTLRDRLSAAHNLLKAHGEGVRAIRRAAPHARVGFAPCGWVMIPKNDSPAEVEKARKVYLGLWKNDPTGCVAFFSDPVFLGDYPKEYYLWYKDVLPKITDADRELIAQPVDYYGQNIYSGAHIDIAADGSLLWEGFPSDHPRTAMDWDIAPEALYWGPKFLYERYKTPILITENGMASHDFPCRDGKVHDAYRTDYIHTYLAALDRVCREGVDVRGYFYWSLMDNFEWHWGYTRRFGLVYVDYPTQKRIPKDSFYEYRDLIRAHREGKR